MFLFWLKKLKLLLLVKYMLYVYYRNLFIYFCVLLIVLKCLFIEYVEFWNYDMLGEVVFIIKSVIFGGCKIKFN